MVSKRKTIYWNVISRSFPCLRRKKFRISLINYALIIKTSGIIGGLESLRSLASLLREIRKDFSPITGIDANIGSVFHILDSLRESPHAKKDSKLLQTLLLTHFEGTPFLESRVAANVAEVICLIFLPFY
jgi:hypothetical protein